MSARLRISAWVTGMLAATAVEAGCSRAVEAPMAPMGLSVVFDGGQGSGLYPQLLRELGTATGCEFHFQRVPRARLQKLFESGQADLLAPAARAPSRDAHGDFVPLMQVRASLLLLTPEHAAPRSLAELFALPDYKLAVVRGFTYGAEYDAAILRLRNQRRLVEEQDPAGVARALRMGLAHATVMTPHIFVGTLLQEADLAPLAKQLRLQPLAELGWAESGVYLSRHRLTDADRRLLTAALKQAARSGRMWRLFNEIYPPDILAGSLRPLP